MNRKLVFILASVGVVTFSVSFMNELQNEEVSAQNEQSKVENGQVFSNEGDVTKVITVEEQASEKIILLL